MIYVAYFFGAAFFTNAIPHWVRGLMGQAFQSPFASPPGKGLSSATVNVLWAMFNFAVSYVLLVRIGSFDIREDSQLLAVGLGALAMSLMLAQTFGKLHGGDLKSSH